MKECVESSDCKCGHGRDRHIQKPDYYWKCHDCKCDIYEEHRHGKEHCFCQRHRQEDGTRFICY